MKIKELYYYNDKRDIVDGGIWGGGKGNPRAYGTISWNNKISSFFKLEINKLQ